MQMPAHASIEAAKTTAISSGNAMMVISVSNRDFSSDFLERAIPMLLQRHALVRVLIADELMIYNRFDTSLAPERAAASLAQHRHDRHRQLARIIEPLPDAQRVEVASYEDFCDAGYARILRRLLLLAHSDRHVMEKLESIALAYLDTSADDCDFRMAASIYYLIDETAWTMNLAANYGMSDNYYPGDVGKILRIFYCDSYEYDLFAHLGVARHTHRFWRLNESARGLAPQMIWAHEN
ncbi:MAG: hypothetical protein AAGD47_13825 [Pseudomonadota bacterium]